MNRFLYKKNVFTKEGEDFKNNFGQKVRGAMAPVAPPVPTPMQGCSFVTQARDAYRGRGFEGVLRWVNSA